LEKKVVDRDFIPLTRPLLDQREAEAASRVILSGWVTQGQEVSNFEQEFAALVGSGYACAVSSCTTALHLALLVAGVKPGDEVITVSHSFIATANSINYCGAKPVFADIQRDTFNIDPDAVEPLITKKTAAILCVHQMGMPCDLRAILSIGKKYLLPVIEDAACAIGSKINLSDSWQKIGKPHGDLACFSFHPRKVLTTGDGGMITTSNREWDQKLRLLRQHGMDVSDTVRHGARKVIFESYPIRGYNYRLTDIQAAVGRIQLQRLSSIIKRRRLLVSRYLKLLADIPSLVLPSEPPWAKSNWQSFCVGLPALCDQRKVMQQMFDDGIATRRGVMCAHLEGAYSTSLASLDPYLKESELARNRAIILPLFHQLTERQQDRVVASLNKCCSAIL